MSRSAFRMRVIDRKHSSWRRSTSSSEIRSSWVRAMPNSTRMATRGTAALIQNRVENRRFENMGSAPFVGGRMPAPFRMSIP